MSDLRNGFHDKNVIAEHEATNDDYQFGFEGYAVEISFQNQKWISTIDGEKFGEFDTLPEAIADTETHISDMLA